MTLDARQEQELTSGTDTLLHYHLADRVMQLSSLKSQHLNLKSLSEELGMPCSEMLSLFKTLRHK
jgi:hypothetical protein